MRKLTLLVLTVLCTTLLSFAQEINVGFRLGVTSSIFRVDDRDLDADEVLKRSTGLTLAIPIDIKISDKFSFQPELSYISRGFKIVDDSRKLYDYYASLKYAINYFEVPLLAKGNFEVDKLRFSVYAGPSLGLALGGKLSFYEDDDGDIFRESEKIDFKDSDINRIEIGLNFGGMASYEIGKGRAFADFRLQTGLTKVFEDTRSNAIGFSVGYMIPLSL